MGQQKSDGPGAIFSLFNRSPSSVGCPVSLELRRNDPERLVELPSRKHKEESHLISRDTGTDVVYNDEFLDNFFWI